MQAHGSAGCPHPAIAISAPDPAVPQASPQHAVPVVCGQRRVRYRLGDASRVGERCSVAVQHFQDCYPGIRPEYSDMSYVIGPVDPAL